MTLTLPPRWHKAKLSRAQRRYVDSKKRINVVVAGRRSFKTEGAKRRLVLSAMQFSKFADGCFFACAPTQAQAKRIFWEDLKAMVPDWFLKVNRRRSISDSELTIQLMNGVTIKVAGLDKPQRIEGKDWDGGVVTEFGDCKPDVFDFHIRPMMTRGGWIDIEGVPEGRNHYYDFAMKVQDSQAAEESGLKGSVRGGSYHHWTTEDVLHLWLGREGAQRELDDARGSLDPQVFNQEYRAQFVSFEGRAYHQYTDDNVAYGGNRVLYQRDLPLILMFDFNASPGVCLYGQEHPHHLHPWLKNPNHRKSTLTAAIGEVYIPRNSNTRKVCEQIKADWGDIHTGDVILHGDPAGGAKTSSAVDGSDWDIIKESLKSTFGNRLKDRVASCAPSIRSRLNAMNARLRAADDTIGLVIDGKACPRLIRDLDGVEADEQGDIIKVQGGPLTHISDALGYYIHEKHPLGGSVFKISH